VQQSTLCRQGLLGFLPLLALLTRQSVSVFGISITDSIPLLIVWTLWWPLLYLLLIPAGRAWCGFLCPVGLAVNGRSVGS